MHLQVRLQTFNCEICYEHTNMLQAKEPPTHNNSGTSSNTVSLMLKGRLLGDWQSFVCNANDLVSLPPEHPAAVRQIPLPPSLQPILPSMSLRNNKTPSGPVITKLHLYLPEGPNSQPGKPNAPEVLGSVLPAIIWFCFSQGMGWGIDRDGVGSTCRSQSHRGSGTWNH